MSGNEQEEAQKFRMLLQQKIQALLDKFADGQISREQFHLLYKRYHARLAIVDHALMTGNPDAVAIAQTGPSTLQIIEETRGKAIGMQVYHHKKGTLIETLGQFDIADEVFQPILAQYVPFKALSGPAADRIHQITDTRWLLFSVGTYTTTVTLFTNEPTQHQVQELERLHTDFETANGATLQGGAVEANQLGYPFVVFVQQKLHN